MLLDPVREIVAAEAMPPAAAAARVVLAELGDSVGVVGAGVVAREFAGSRHGTVQEVSRV
jgi:glucokinase